MRHCHYHSSQRHGHLSHIQRLQCRVVDLRPCDPRPGTARRYLQQHLYRVVRDDCRIRGTSTSVSIKWGSREWARRVHTLIRSCLAVALDQHGSQRAIAIERHFASTAAEHLARHRWSHHSRHRRVHGTVVSRTKRLGLHLYVAHRVLGLDGRHCRSDDLVRGSREQYRVFSHKL